MVEGYAISISGGIARQLQIVVWVCGPHFPPSPKLHALEARRWVQVVAEGEEVAGAHSLQHGNHLDEGVLNGPNALQARYRRPHLPLIHGLG